MVPGTADKKSSQTSRALAQGQSQQPQVGFRGRARTPLANQCRSNSPKAERNPDLLFNSSAWLGTETQPSPGQSTFGLHRCASPRLLSRDEAKDSKASLKDMLQKSEQKVEKLEMKVELLNAEVDSLRTQLDVQLIPSTGQSHGASQQFSRNVDELRENNFLPKLSHKNTFALITRARSELITSSSAGVDIDFDAVLVILDAALSLVDHSKCLEGETSSSRKQTPSWETLSPAQSPTNTKPATSFARGLSRPMTSCSKWASTHDGFASDDDQSMEQGSTGLGNYNSGTRAAGRSGQRLSQTSPQHFFHELSDCESVHFTKPKGGPGVVNFLNLMNSDPVAPIYTQAPKPMLIVPPRRPKLHANVQAKTPQTIEHRSLNLRPQQESR